VNHLSKLEPIGRLALSAALMCGAVPAAAQTPQEVLQQVKYEQHIDAQLPLDLKFHDETGREVALGEYFGKRPVVLALVYYECPMLCTLVLNGLVRSLRTMSLQPNSDFDVVAVSFNPKETPKLAAEKKSAYLRDYGKAATAPGWHFLTGDATAIERLTETVGFRYMYDARTQQYAHASGIIVTTPAGKLYRYFYGIEYAPRDLRLALVDASAGKAGTLVDQMLLYCYHYDPQTGKYGVLITRVIRVLGTSTVLLLGGFVLLSLRRERRAARAHGARSS
jgi:protein SCO1/2